MCTRELGALGALGAGGVEGAEDGVWPDISTPMGFFKIPASASEATRMSSSVEWDIQVVHRIDWLYEADRLTRSLDVTTKVLENYDPVKVSPLFLLSREIRDMIYEYCVVNDSPLDLYPRVSGNQKSTSSIEYHICRLSLRRQFDVSRLALLQTNRQIGSEAGAVFFGKNVWKIKKQVPYWSIKLSQECLKHIRHVNIHFDKRDLDDDQLSESDDEIRTRVPRHLRATENEKHDWFREELSSMWTQMSRFGMELNLLSLELNFKYCACPACCQCGCRQLSRALDSFLPFTTGSSKRLLPARVTIQGLADEDELEYARNRFQMSGLLTPTTQISYSIDPDERRYFFARAFRANRSVGRSFSASIFGG